jgi:hypothetical protein
VNQAFDQAVRTLLGRPERPVSRAPSPPPAPRPRPASRPPSPSTGSVGPWVQYDEPSFTIDVLPVDAFHALLAAGERLGRVLADDPPYVLEVALTTPAPCWCRLELLPEAGGTTVMLTVAGTGRHRPPPIEDVRDVWIDAVNRPEA